ncbi:MAG: hypothetical protein BRC38_00950, partial [Cyanobacteria bacterium QH_6_48_35]
QLEKSYLHTTFMFLKLPTRLFKHGKYFAARCYIWNCFKSENKNINEQNKNINEQMRHSPN